MYETAYALRYRLPYGKNSKKSTTYRKNFVRIWRDIFYSGFIISLQVIELGLQAGKQQSQERAEQICIFIVIHCRKWWVLR